MHHGPAGVDDADEGELDQRRGSRFRGVDAVVGGIRGHEVGEMVQHDDESGDAAQPVEIRCSVDSWRFVDVGCDATGYGVREERCCDSFDEASGSARHRRHAGRAMIAGRLECHRCVLEVGGIKNVTSEHMKDSSEYHLQKRRDRAVGPEGQRTTGL